MPQMLDLKRVYRTIEFMHPVNFEPEGKQMLTELTVSFSKAELPISSSTKKAGISHFRLLLQAGISVK